MFKDLRVTIRCSGLVPEEGKATAKAIQDDFRRYRPWHRNAYCRAGRDAIILQAENDYDADGEVLREDLETCLREYASTFGRMEVLAIEPCQASDHAVSGRAPVASSTLSEEDAD